MRNEVVPYTPHPLTAAPTISADLLAGQLAASSIAQYRSDMRQYTRFATGAALDWRNPVTLALWRDWFVTETQFSPNTINRRMKAVQRIMHEAAQRGLLDRDTAQRFRDIAAVKESALRSRKKIHNRTRITPDAMRRICEAPDTSTLVGLRDAALLATLASSGVRCSEAATLTTAQIEQQGKGYRLVITGKGQAEPRLAPLSSEAYTLIQRWFAHRPLLSQHIFTSFAGRSGKPNDRTMSAVAVWQTVQRYADACDLAHIKPHDFRRFVGTQLAAQDIRLAQKALGHKRIDTTASNYVLDELPEGLTDNLY